MPHFARASETAASPRIVSAPANRRDHPMAALQRRVGSSGIHHVVQRQIAENAPKAGPLPAATDERTPDEKKAAVTAGVAEAKRLLEDETIDIGQLPPLFDAIKAKYRMKTLELQGATTDSAQQVAALEIKGEVNPNCFMTAVRRLLRWLGFRAPTPADAAANAAAAAAIAGGMPQFVANFRRGNAFNAALNPEYPHSEVYLNAPGGKYVRVDSYDPAGGEIISRKHTQLALIGLATALGYIDELAKKYPPGRRVANVPSSGALANQVLVGTMILEVPVQANPIPAAVLARAAAQNVVIRDDEGRVY